MAVQAQRLLLGLVVDMVATATVDMDSNRAATALRLLHQVSLPGNKLQPLPLLLADRLTATAHTLAPVTINLQAMVKHLAWAPRQVCLPLRHQAWVLCSRPMATLAVLRRRPRRVMRHPLQ